MRHARTFGLIAVIVLALVAGFAAPIVAVFFTLVALNLVLGPRENIPFSTYPMFAYPAANVWTLRFEDAEGTLIPIGKMGVNPFFAKKRFATELGVARARGITDLAAVRHSASQVLADQIENHRPSYGPLATSPITIVLVEYSLESDGLLKLKTPMMVTTPH